MKNLLKKLFLVFLFFSPVAMAGVGGATYKINYTYANAVNTATYLSAANTTIQARIQGVITGGSSLAGANATNGASVVGIVTGSSCVVDVWYNGATSYMATTLTFPSPGTYLVGVNVTVSGYGATYTNLLSAWAIRIN